MEDSLNLGNQKFGSFIGYIPSTVRYHPSICPNAKLLYCEITATCDRFGICRESNNYFAALYQVSTKSITNWLSQLAESDFIKVNFSYKQGTKCIENRCILVPSSFYTYGKNVLEGIEKMFPLKKEEIFHTPSDDAAHIYKDDILLNNKLLSKNNIYIDAPIETVKPQKLKSFDELVGAYTKSEKLKKVLFDFIAMRQANKKKMTNRAMEILFSKLDQLAKTDTDKCAVVEQSIFNCWVGIFPLKEVNSNLQSTASTIIPHDYNADELNAIFDKLNEDILERKS